MSQLAFDFDLDVSNTSIAVAKQDEVQVMVKAHEETAAPVSRRAAPKYLMKPSNTGK